MNKMHLDPKNKARCKAYYASILPKLLKTRTANRAAHKEKLLEKRALARERYRAYLAETGTMDRTLLKS